MSREETAWNKGLKQIHESGKPCHTLKYCPYGPLVEQFPLLPTLRKEAIEHNEWLKEQLGKGEYFGEQKTEFENDVLNFKAEDHPLEYTREQLMIKCLVFGHDCPMYHAAEPLCEDGILQ